MPKILPTIATVEIKFPDGNREIEMELKKSWDIEYCEKGKVVVVNLVDGQQLTGIFKGMADEDVLLGTLDGKLTLGYKQHWISNYFEEIKKDKK